MRNLIYLELFVIFLNKMKGKMEVQQNFTEQQMIQQDLTASTSPLSPLKNFICGNIQFIHRQQTSIISYFFKTFSLLLFVFHILFSQQIISEQNYNQFFSSVKSSSYSGSAIIITFQVISIILKLITIECIYFDTKTDTKIIGLSWINQKVLSSFKNFIGIDMTLSAYLFLFNWQQNIILFLSSSFIEIVYAIYFENYLFRKDVTYMSSTLHNIIFQSFIISSFTVNVVCINLEDYKIFCLSHTVIGIILFIWFFKWGRNLYFRGLYKTITYFMLSIYFSLVIVILHNMIEDMPILAMEQILKFIITFLVIFGLIKMTDRKYRMISKKKLKGKIKSYELSILYILENSFDNAEYQSLYFGYLNLYRQEEDLKNYPLLEEQMIGMNNKPKQFSNQRQNGYKCMMKCLYERQIKFSENKQIILNYCEFLYNEMGNLYLMVTYLEKLNKFNLNIIDLVKISKLKLLAQQENKRLNSELYQNKLNIEDIIEAQNYFKAIEEDIVQYLHNKLTIWCYFGNDEVEILQLKQKMAQNFKLIDQISKKWKNISKFFNCQQLWKYIYLNFMLFMKNQKVNLKEIDEINISFSNRNLFHSSKIFFQENRDTKKFITQTILFNHDSFCIRTKMKQDELIITQVSKNFYKNTLYTKEEIKGCQLNILMPEQIRESHSKTVLEWIQSGLISNDSSYNISFTSFLNQQKMQFPIVKYYKAHYNIERGLQFIFLLKVNNKQDNIGDKYISEDKQILRQTLKLTKKEIQQEGQITINKQFKQGKQFNNLFLQKNIFIKDEMLQSCKIFKQIKIFKICSRIFILSILTSLIVLSQLTGDNVNNLNDYGSQFINFVTMYRFPMVLATAYMKSFLNVGNQTKIKSQIASATSGILTNSKQSITLKTLFDPTLNLPSNYGSYYNYNNVQNLTYNQIDIFYSIVSDITSLSTLPINRTGKIFRHFNSYIKPSYDNMMNSTKFQLHSTFLKRFQQMKMNQLEFMIAQLSLFILILVITFFNMHIFIQKMKNIILIMGDFSLNDLNKILGYWHLIGRSFYRMFNETYINAKTQDKPNTKKKYSSNSDFIQSKEKIVLNKKVRKMALGKKHQSKMLKFRFYILISMVIIIILTILIQIQMILAISKLQSFEQSGFYFLQYFPTSTIYGFGCMEKYYSLQYPQQIQFNPNRFQDVMSTMSLFGSSKYIGQTVDDNSPYYLKQKNYFFGNPCTYNPAVLNSFGITVSKCQTICNEAFKNGLSTVFRQAQKIGQNYMKGKISLSAANLDQYTISFSLIGAFVLDAIATWQKQFTSRIITVQQFNYTLSIIIASIIFVLHLIINEFLISRKIKQDFEFVSKMYKFYVPEFILINQKVLKQKFVLEGLIVDE